jgi:hypothetical protein
VGVGKKPGLPQTVPPGGQSSDILSELPKYVLGESLKYYFLGAQKRHSMVKPAQVGIGQIHILDQDGL